jgi:hypothetical protein
MTYDEAMDGDRVDRTEIDREVRRHGLDPSEFWDEWTKKRAPNSRDVLEWLGY